MQPAGACRVNGPGHGTADRTSAQPHASAPPPRAFFMARWADRASPLPDRRPACAVQPLPLGNSATEDGNEKRPKSTGTAAPQHIYRDARRTDRHHVARLASSTPKIPTSQYFLPEAGTHDAISVVDRASTCWRGRGLQAIPCPNDRTASTVQPEPAKKTSHTRMRSRWVLGKLMSDDENDLG